MSEQDSKAAASADNARIDAYSEVKDAEKAGSGSAAKAGESDLAGSGLSSEETVVMSPIAANGSGAPAASVTAAETAILPRMGADGSGGAASPMGADGDGEEPYDPFAGFDRPAAPLPPTPVLPGGDSADGSASDYTPIPARASNPASASAQAPSSVHDSASPYAHGSAPAPTQIPDSTPTQTPASVSTPAPAPTPTSTPAPAPASTADGDSPSVAPAAARLAGVRFAAFDDDPKSAKAKSRHKGKGRGGDRHKGKGGEAKDGVGFGRGPEDESADDAGADAPQAGTSAATGSASASVPHVTGREVLKRFAAYYKPYRGLFFFDLACAVILACIDLAFPQFLNFFTRDFFLRPADQVLGSLGVILALFVVLYGVRTACQYFITSWGHVMGAYMEADMRADLFEQYQRLSFSYYDKNDTGTMMSKMLTDLFDISELAHHGPENLFICTLKIVGSFVLLSFISVPLALAMVGATVLMAIYAVWRNYIRRTVFRENRERMADINARVQDSLGGIRVVKAFGNEPSEIRRFAAVNGEFTKTKKQAYRFLGSFHAANSLYQGVLYTLTIVGGGYLVATGGMRPADLAIFALYIGIFIAPVEQLVNFVETLQKGYAGFRRFVEVLAIDPDVKDEPGAMPLRKGPGEVRYRDVHFSYDPGREVLHGLNLTVPAGKTVALVGPSGGGKTTTCSLLPRFYDVTDGSIEIDGMNVRGATLKSLRSVIGIVQQDVYLFNGTVRENIAYGCPEATAPDIERAARQANAHEFIMGLENDYDTLVGERGARLSGGQKQRIAIARLFLRNPRILILDEATSALDNESELAVQRSLEALSAGRTTIVIAHRLSTIRSADLIAVVDDGRVVEQGCHEELLAMGGTYARYYHLQFGRKKL